MIRWVVCDGSGHDFDAAVIDFPFERSTTRSEAHGGMSHVHSEMELINRMSHTGIPVRHTLVVCLVLKLPILSFRQDEKPLRRYDTYNLSMSKPQY